MDVWVEEMASKAIDDYERHINQLFEAWYHNEGGMLQDKHPIKELMKAAFEQGRLLGLQEGLQNDQSS